MAAFFSHLGPFILYFSFSVVFQFRKTLDIKNLLYTVKQARWEGGEIMLLALDIVTVYWFIFHSNHGPIISTLLIWADGVLILAGDVAFCNHIKVD